MTPTTSTDRVAAVTHRTDASPFARALAQQLSLHALTDGGQRRLNTFAGVVGVRSAVDPQKATIRAEGDGIIVVEGLAEDVDIEVTVAPTRREVILAHEVRRPSGPGLSEVAALLSPALPDWTKLIDQFWDAAQSIPGMPSLRIVETGATRDLTRGSNPRCYEIHGAPEALTRLLAGLDFFADSVYAGELQIRGSFSDFSIVSGASMKVMWHV